ncbi:MAG: DUF1501 domain-containing protein [Isosphaeraceae bacterium]
MPRSDIGAEADGCAGFRRSAPTRRDLIRLGGLAGVGLTLPDLFRLRAGTVPGRSEASTFGRARSVIMIYLHGGPAQQETWDPKPTGPSPERGEFGAIPTSVPGVHFSELLPRSARLMHRCAVIRSLSHPNANHVQASLPAMTGRHHPPGTESRGDFPPSPTDFPSVGAVVDRVRPTRGLPTWVQVGPTMTRSNGTVLHGQSPGFLGAAHNPLLIDQDLTAERVSVDAVSPDGTVSAGRFASRRTLLERFDDQRRAIELASNERTFDGYQRRALDLLSSPTVGRAFDLASETPAARDAYGRNTFGQSCLLARRLAEAGVPIVSVHYCRRPPGWDTHGKHFKAMKDSLCPTLDLAFSALVTDLGRLGLLDSTLVWVNCEFGRTPRVNSGAGRDHWPWAYSQILAGGGLAGGVCVGATDSIAAYPTRDPHDPSEMIATAYHLLGINPDLVIHDQLGRPYSVVHGSKIDALLV